MFIWKHLRFLQNLRVHWLVKFELDSWLFLSPFILIAMYPFTIYSPFMNHNRQMRRRTFDGVHLKSEDGNMTPEQVAEYYKSLGFEDPM